MLLNRKTLDSIGDGSVTVAFRRWKRPTVKAGGSLLTPIGQLAIESVDRVEVDGITVAEAKASGFASLSSLKSELSKREVGDVYRIRLHLAGPDPRIAMRQKIPDAAELETIRQRLTRLDASSGSGPWTHRVLELLRTRPAERAGDLAEVMGMAKTEFKTRVRKLKALGLTESLKVGYRVSPRGQAVLDEA